MQHVRKGLDDERKSIVQEARDIQLAMELITLGARLQMLESETQLSRGRLIKLYKKNYAVVLRQRDAPVFHRLVYDVGTKYSCVDVLQCMAILAQNGSL